MLDQWMVRSMLVERLPPSNYSFPVGAVERCGGCVAPHCNRSRFSSRHHQLRDSTGRDPAPTTSSTENFFFFSSSSSMQSAVAMRDSAAAQSVEFRPQERPMLLPRFFGKERLSFAKSDSRRGPSSSRMSDSPSLREVEQAASGFALGLTCKYLFLPHFPCSLSGRLADRVATEETQKKAARSQLEEKV